MRTAQIAISCLSNRSTTTVGPVTESGKERELEVEGKPISLNAQDCMCCEVVLGSRDPGWRLLELLGSSGMYAGAAQKSKTL